MELKPDENRYNSFVTRDRRCLDSVTLNWPNTWLLSLLGLLIYMLSLVEEVLNLDNGLRELLALIL